MSRAERRRRQREEKKRPQQSISLVNPQKDNFEAFIFANALHCDRVVEAGAGEGRHLVICGAGPSLAEEADRYVRDADQVWGVNSALTWLLANGHPATHGFTVDQQPQMLEEWVDAPDVEYLLASTVHPHLTEYLLSKDRPITWFHNFVGIRKPPVAYAVCLACESVTDHGVSECPQCAGELDDRMMAYEDWLYSALFPATVRSGSGLNSVTRAIDVARYMEFETITVLGADCAIRTPGPIPEHLVRGSPEHLDWLKQNTVMHADGGHALASGASALTMGGEIDGRWWESKPDMIISAVWLVKMQRHMGADRLRLIGDTLPNALANKSDDFLARMPTMVDSQGEPIPIEFEPIRM